MAQFSNWKSCGCSNPNILLNPRFCINQRGLSEYSGSGYTVDMWTIEYDGEKTLTVGDGYVELNTNTIGTWFNFCQMLEVPLSAGAYTLSFLVDDYTKIRNAYALNRNTRQTISATAKDDLIVFTFKIADDEAFDVVGLQKKEEIGSVKVYAAKLETGTVSTLALDLMQPVTAQVKQKWLMECQRYYYRQEYISDQFYIGIAKELGDGYAYLKYDLPVEMRIAPTIRYNKKTVIWGRKRDGSISYGTEEADLKVHGGNNKRELELEVLNSQIANEETYIVFMNSADGYVEFSAEL